MKRLYLFLFSTLGLCSQGQTIAVTSFATGFSSPVEITHTSDDRLFVVQQGGTIKILNANGTTNTTPFLTLGPSVIDSGGEQGLLGLAFHPDYANNGYFYVNYTRDGDGATNIARYSVSTTDPNVADATSGVVLLTISQPFSNHNGGTLRFGPDGYLYIGMGDGGSGGDPGNRAQNLSQNLGKMLRIDVDSASPYGIPATNPFVGIDGNDEIFYYGVRNPWKFSFDRLNGDLWIADVGQNEVEEINKLTAPLTPGLNLGWRCYEGTQPYNISGCPEESTITMPFAEYTHAATSGCSITGGYVYRGAMYPNFYGNYFFADYCKSELATVVPDGTLTFTTNLSFAGNITTLGEDNSGELYVAGGGTIYKISDLDLSSADFTRNGIKMYPNPSNGEVFLDAPDSMYPLNFTIIDDAGRVVFNQKIEATSGNHFQTSDLARGVYLVKMTDKEGKQFSSKLAIQ
ncbi:PQQ-dependent sugar dehydrogenase [Flavobacterium silvaticum]|uniref:T9SS type A sorting domain-containing protein n=1 Tax=Flavobacterium silvaticum TaxID=1852020 RepID=A0A972JIH3_9FLAO|nr:PQQ-dependent sugar dehydrogenase [Flavobacterium silvaticum]NMH28243.1 T9SS type A sorting domain-containing protein [Flavobacterium silvaticum]